MYEHNQAAAALYTAIGARALVVRSFPDPVQTVKPEHDGFLMEAEPEQLTELELVVTVPKNRNVRGIIVRSLKENKPIVAKTNRADENKNYSMFRKTVRSRLTLEETMSTKHDVNNIRLVAAENGIFQMWEIAIPTRIVGLTANFFLTVQRLYKATVYNLNGQIYMPEHEYSGYKEWADLQALLREMVNVEKLPAISEPVKAPAVASITESNHKVMFFCLASGTGMAQTSQGQAFIHWRELLSNDRLVCVKENQLIGGDVVSTDKGLQLKNITAAE